MLLTNYNNDQLINYCTDWTTETLSYIPIKTQEDFPKVIQALEDLLQHNLVPSVNSNPELKNRITMLKEMLDVRLEICVGKENCNEFKIIVKNQIEKKIHDLKQFSPKYFFALDNECYSIFRRIMGYLHYPDNNKDFSDKAMNSYFKDFEWITKSVPSSIIKRQLYRLNGNDSGGEYFDSTTSYPSIHAYNQIHEITELLFLKYQFGSDIDEKTKHYNEAHNKAIEIENFHLMMQAKQMGIELTLKSLKFLRVIDKESLLLFPLDCFYTCDRFIHEKANYSIELLPTLDEMKNNVNFMKAIKFWNFFENKRQSYASPISMENFIWRNWFLAYFSTQYPIGRTEGFAYILMLLETNDFFDKYEKGNLLNVLKEFFLEFKEETMWKSFKHEKLNIEIDNHSDYMRKYKYIDMHLHGYPDHLWEDFKQFALERLAGKELYSDSSSKSQIDSIQRSKEI